MTPPVVLAKKKKKQVHFGPVNTHKAVEPEQPTNDRSTENTLNDQQTEHLVADVKSCGKQAGAAAKNNSTCTCESHTAEEQPLKNFPQCTPPNETNHFDLECTEEVGHESEDHMSIRNQSILEPPVFPPVWHRPASAVSVPCHCMPKPAGIPKHTHRFLDSSSDEPNDEESTVKSHTKPSAHKLSHFACWQKVHFPGKKCV